MNKLEQLLGFEIDKTYCITLETNIENHKRIMDISKEYGMDIELFKTKRNNENPELGCMESHMACIKMSKELGYKNVLILEEDFYFLPQRFENHLRINKKFRESFDILFLGYNMNYGYRHDINIMKIQAFTCAHSYILNSCVFDYIIKSYDEYLLKGNIGDVLGFEKEYDLSKKVFDLFLSKMVCQRRKRSYGLFPMISHQKPGFSSIENKVVNYNDVIEKHSMVFTNKYYADFETYLINLDRRRDRLETFINKSQNIFSRIERFGAVDGATYDFTPYMDLFSLDNLNIKNKYGTHGFRKGVLGCALSHYLIWERIINNDNFTDKHKILVLEDDINYHNDFIKRMNEVLMFMDNVPCDLFYLGYTDYKKLSSDSVINNKFIKLSGEERTRGGGTFAYVITKNGARKLVEAAKKYNIQQGIDWFMIDQYNDLLAYKLVNDIIKSNVYKGDGDDSDIQNNNDVFVPKTKPPKVDNPCLFYNLNFVFDINKNKFVNKENDLELLVNDDNKSLDIKKLTNYVYRYRYKDFSMNIDLSKKYIFIYSKNIDSYFLDLYYKLSFNKDIILFTETIGDFSIGNLYIIKHQNFKKVYMNVKQENIEHIYTDTLDIFINYYIKQQINYIYLNNQNESVYYSYEIFLRNNMDNINEVLFINKKDKELFEIMYEDIDITKLKLLETKYNVVPIDDKEDILICLNKKDLVDSVNVFTGIRSNIPNVKVIYYTDMITNPNNNPNIIIKKYDMYEIKEDLKKARFVYCSEFNYINDSLFKYGMKNGLIGISKNNKELEDITIPVTDNFSKTIYNVLNNKIMYKKYINYGLEL